MAYQISDKESSLKEFKSYLKKADHRKMNTWCRWNSSYAIDPYGMGCQHNCSYCYAKSLLDFRHYWNPQNPAMADINKIRKDINKKLQPGDVIRMGIMTDPFQPLEKQKRVTYETIKALNERGVEYLIVTKSDMIASPEYLEILDKQLAHVQISITTTDDKLCSTYEHAVPTSRRIKAVETLAAEGIDVCVRLSPFIPEYVDVDVINNIKCDKILIEFLKVSPWIQKWFDIDYSPYTLKRGGYRHLELEDKIRFTNLITGFKEHTVGEFVEEHDAYFREHYNTSTDCCNLRCLRK